MPSEYTVNESDGFVTICVSAQSIGRQTDGMVIVALETQPGTARGKLYILHIHYIHMHNIMCLL